MGATYNMLGDDRATVARWVRLGHFPAVRLPTGHVRIRRHDVEKLLAEDPGEE